LMPLANPSDLLPRERRAGADHGRAVALGLLQRRQDPRGQAQRDRIIHGGPECCQRGGETWGDRRVD